MLMEADLAEDYTDFLHSVGSRLRRALISAYGPEVGAEATADALAYAWENWERLRALDNPAGYLYRVGQSKARHYRRRPRRLPPVSEAALPWVEPGLPGALQRLSVRQRQAVLLCHGYGWTLAEVADLWGTGRSTVQRQLERAMSKLRRDMGVSLD